MTYYAFIFNDEINGKGQCQNLTKGFENIEITEEVYNSIDHYIYNNGEIVLNPNYDKEQAEIRKRTFLEDFFKVGEYGYYRRTPKGYQSAIESINTAFNNFILMQQSGITEFPADVFIFYTEPDFTDPEQCTEKWLIEHQHKNNTWTAQEFGAFYSAFTRAWNNQEHETIETPVDEEEPTEENIETPAEESGGTENG